MGISVDYLELVQKTIGISFTLVPTADWEESLKFAKERKCDILSLAMPTPERKKYMNFSKPYLIAPLVLATKTDKFFVTDIKEILKEKIGVVKGYSFGELLKLEYPTIRLVEVQSVEEGLEKVAKGEIYGFLDSLITIGYVIQKEYLNVLKIGGKIPQSFELGFAVRNDEPVLLAILEKALENIDENTRQAITNKWVNIKYENGFDYSLLWKLIVVFGLLFLFFGYRYSVVHRYNLQIKKNLEVIDKYVLFLHTDKKGIIIDVSQALCELSGYKKHELIGKSEKMLRRSDMSFCQSKECLSKITKNQAWEGELKNIKKDGTTYWVYAQISPTFAQNGEVIGYSSFQTDITDKKRIEEISHTDQLTQIFNRLYLDRSLKIELSRVRRYKDNFFSIILMDIDFFKDINDSYGHTVGDSILKDIVRLIKDNIRESDVFGRWGGEEFLIVCPNTTKKDTLLLAEKIRQKIQDYKFGLDITCTMSFGVAKYETSDDEDSIFLRVDKALYIAKNTGRNRVSSL
jgi:diguanylate cyclase (GGDEF)-like protein/PAS domain S-box-containing protein